MTEQPTEFIQRWTVPDENVILNDWKKNLLIMGNDCQCDDGYHRLWGGLRLLGHRGLYWEAKQLHRLLFPILKPAKTIVLGGSADQLVLALLSDIAGDNTGKQYHLIDRCPAPAAVARAYAAHHNLTLSTYQGDLTGPVPVKAPVDLVFMHFTLDFMDQQSRLAVLKQLAGCLAPNGRIVIVLRKRDNPKVDVDLEKWEKDIRAQMAGAVFNDHALGDELDKYLFRYGSSLSNRPLDVKNNDALLELFSDVGLRVIAAEPTVRAQMLGNSSDPLRAGEHSTVYIVGRDEAP